MGWVLVIASQVSELIITQSSNTQFWYRVVIIKKNQISSSYMSSRLSKKSTTYPLLKYNCGHTKCMNPIYDHGSQCFWKMPNNHRLENCQFFHETHQLCRGLKYSEPVVLGSRFLTFLKMTGIKIFQNPPPHWYFLQDRLPRGNPTSTEMGFIHIRVINLCPLDGALVDVCTLGQLILT